MSQSRRQNKSAKRSARRRRKRGQQRTATSGPARNGNKRPVGGATQWSPAKGKRSRGPPRLFVRVLRGQSGTVAYQAKLPLSEVPSSLSSLPAASRLPLPLTVVRLSVWPPSAHFIAAEGEARIQGTTGEVVANVLSHNATYTGPKGAYLLVTYQTPGNIAPIGRTDTSATYYAPTLNPKRATITKTVTQATLTNPGEFKDYLVFGIERLRDAPAVIGTLAPPGTDGPWHFIRAHTVPPYDGAQVRFQVEAEAKESRYVVKLKARPVPRPSRPAQAGL